MVLGITVHLDMTQFLTMMPSSGDVFYDINVLNLDHSSRTLTLIHLNLVSSVGRHSRQLLNRNEQYRNYYADRKTEWVLFLSSQMMGQNHMLREILGNVFTDYDSRLIIVETCPLIRM